MLWLWPGPWARVAAGIHRPRISIPMKVFYDKDEIVVGKILKELKVERFDSFFGDLELADIG